METHNARKNRIRPLTQAELAERRAVAEKRKADRAKRDAERIAASREAWRQLHQYSVDHQDDWNPGKALKWLLKWEKSIPQFGCKCSQHWKQIKKRVPPKLQSATEFHQWTVDSHNEVNKDLGKPIFVP